MFIYFSLILTQVLCSDQCTYKSNRVTISTDVGLEDIKDELRPTFLRLTSPGCPYSPASDAQWIKASELYPQVNFVTVDCWKNTKICSKYDSSLMTPAHGLVAANSVEIIEASKIGNINSIHESPQAFLDIIQQYALLYPVAPPLVSLTPMTIDSFFNAIDNPIILLHDSTCSNEVPFLNAWAKVSNEEIFPDGNYPRIGMLDCSKYKDECQRWARPYATQTPRALIYSRKTGNFEVLDQYENLNSDKIDGLYANAVIKPIRSIPTPIPVPDDRVNLPSTEGFTILENTELQQRSLETIKAQYKEAFVAPSSACETPEECKPQTLDSATECITINPSAEDHTNSLKIINFLRSLAGLSHDVSEDSTWSQQCYKTAINIHKIGVVPSDHVIKDNYATSTYCGEVANIQVAKNSLLAENSNTVFDASYKFIIDKGAHNDGVVGHRRWLLHPNLQKIGIGFYPYKEENHGSYRLMKAAVTVMRVTENNSPGAFNSLPNNLQFVSWPPSGPFPLQQLPTNWHITHSDFKTAKLTDLRVFVTRDDGSELKIDKLYLSTSQSYGDALVIKMSDEAIERCLPMRTITVNIYNDQNKKIYRFSFQLFDQNDVTEVCLYSSDKSKCPSTVQAENVLGPGQYQANIFSNAQNPVKVIVAEPITLDQNGLKFSAPTRFYVSGSPITGKVIIDRGTIIDVQDPTKTTYKIIWSPQNKKVGKLETAFKANSIEVEVDNPTTVESISIYDLTFYTGIQTNCALSKPLDHGENYDIYYNIGGTSGNYYVMASTSSAFQVYSTTSDSDIANIPSVIQLHSIFDLKNQHTNKRVIKVYTSPIDKEWPINASSFLPGQKKDYQFILVGGSEFYFECDMDIAKYANSITFSQSSQSNNPFKFEAYMPKSVSLANDERAICPLDFITINGGTFTGTSSGTVILPYLRGDANAITANDPSQFFDLYPESMADDATTIQAYPDGSTSKSKCIIEVPGTQSKYQINVDLDQTPKAYNLFIFRPKPGTENKQVTLSIYDKSYDVMLPTSPNDKPFYFENFQDLILDVPTFRIFGGSTQSLLPVFHFDNCGKVQFKYSKASEVKDPVTLTNNITLGQVDYGYPVSVPAVKVTDSLTYDATKINTEDLSVESRSTPTINGITVSNSISINSATVILDSCKLGPEVQISLKKTDNWWPSISLHQTEFSPKQVLIDLGISDSTAHLLEDADYENHILINGVPTDKCASILANSHSSNIGTFTVECSSDKTEIVAVKNKDNKPDLAPEETDPQPPSGGDNDNNNPTQQPPAGGDNDNNNPTQKPPAGGDNDNNNPTQKPPAGGDNDNNNPTQKPPAGGDNDNNNPTQQLSDEIVQVSELFDTTTTGENDINEVQDTGGKKKNGLSGGAIAGIVIACVVVVAAVACAVVYFVLKKKKVAPASSHDEGGDTKKSNNNNDDGDDAALPIPNPGGGL